MDPLMKALLDARKREQVQGVYTGGYLPPGMNPSGVMSTYTPTLREKGIDFLRQHLFADNRAGQDKARKLSDIAEIMTPYGLGTMAYDVGRNTGEGNYGSAMLGAGLAMMPMPGAKMAKQAAKQAAKEAKVGIRAYHGSPHDFDKFDMSKIGTGEGAQAYGHGLYFAESKGVAQDYKRRLAKADASMVKPDAEAISKYQPEWDAIIAEKKKIDMGGYLSPESRQKIIDTTDKLDAIHQKMVADTVARNPHLTKGRMYEVNINADPSHFLDWDKPLPMDHPIREKLADLGMTATGALNAADRNIGKDVFLAARNENLTGEGAYRSMARAIEANRANLKSKYGEAALFKDVGELANKEIGGPGIKYLDQGSRAAGEGSRNYVVFDDKLIDIKRKWALIAALLGAGGAAGLSQQPDNKPQTY